MSSLEPLSFQWRAALDAAEDALGAAARSASALRFPPDELRSRERELVVERAETQAILEELAHETRTQPTRRLTGPRATAELLGLDHRVRACVFDLDGVLTASAALHAAAWQETFDELLARHHESAHQEYGQYGPWRPFDTTHDYYDYIHGRPRIEGVHTFLASRGIRLAEGRPTDPPGSETAHGLANRKQESLSRRLGNDGVHAFAGSTRFLEIAHEAGLPCGVVSPSANTTAILSRSGLAELVDDVVDGGILASEHLRGKPAPDSVLAACRRLAVRPDEVATFETTRAGIDAGHAAGVHRVIAVDRTGHAAHLRQRGADRVVTDLGDLIDPVLG